MNKGLEPTHPARKAKGSGDFFRQTDARAALTHYDEALSAFTLEAAPELAVDILIGRGLAFRTLNDLSQSISSYDQATHLINELYLGMRRVEVYLYRGAAYSAKRDFDCARNDFRALVDLAEVGRHYAAPIVNLLLLHEAKFALADCSLIIEAQPGFGPALFCRALLHYRCRDWDHSLADFEAAGRLAVERGDEHLERQLVGREQAIADRRRMESDQAKIDAIASPEGRQEGVEYCCLDWIGDGNYTQLTFFDRESSRTVDGETSDVPALCNRLDTEGWMPYAKQSHQQGTSYYYERKKS